VAGSAFYRNDAARPIFQVRIGREPFAGGLVMKRAKDEVREVLDLLPDDCTMADIQYALYVRTQIRDGIWSLENAPTFTQDEIEHDIAQWLIPNADRGV
jgi:hypothetical protein